MAQAEISQVTQTLTRQVRWHNGCRFAIVSRLLGSLLLIAAGLKGYELLFFPAMKTGLFAAPWLIFLVIEYEIALGMSLIFGLWPRFTWPISTFTFITFAIFAAYKSIHGEPSCGCFGRVNIDPRITLAIDMAILGVLTITRPAKASHHPTTHRRLLIATLLFLVVGGTGAWGMIFATPRHAVQEGVVRSGNYLVLEPEKWVGKDCPILGYIDIGAKLKKGKWILVIYDHNCGHCQAAMPSYLEAASMFSRNASDIRIALIEIPPYGPTKPQLTMDSHLKQGNLSDTYQWFAPLPVELALVNGKVIQAQESGEGLKWIQKAQSLFE